MMSMDKRGLKAGNPVAVVILAPDHLKLLRYLNAHESIQLFSSLLCYRSSRQYQGHNSFHVGLICLLIN